MRSRFSVARLLTPSVLLLALACADSPQAPSAASVTSASASTSTSTTAAASATGVLRSERPPEARVYLITPVAGAVVTSPVTVRFGLGGMGIAPAGVEKAGTGHHHLIIDSDLPPLGLPIPSGPKSRHFGKGQTEVDLDLAPGQHTLQLLLGDHFHVPHDPPVVSERITITVAP